MSHCASFLCLNGLFESSFFYAEHLTASDKYKFSRQECVIREFCFAKTTKTSKCLARRDTGTGGNCRSATHCLPSFLRKLANVWCEKALERLEIRCQRTTRHWNQRKFVHSKRQDTGTTGNSLPASNKALELTEILSPRATIRWNGQKFVASERRETGTGGNSLSASDETLERAEIVAARCAAYRVFLRKTREGSWKNSKTRSLYSFTNNRRRGRREKIGYRRLI